MLPGGFDLQTMSLIMWIVIAVCAVTGLMTIKSLDKPMLRVVIAVLLVALCVTCYKYIRILDTCKSTGTTCTFFTAEVPQDGGFIN